MDPMLALGLRLKSRRHKVRMFCNVNHVDWCEEHGIDAQSVFADTQWIIERLGGMMGSWQQGCQEGREAAQQYLKAFPDSCTSLDDALEDFHPHALISQVTTSGPSLKYEMEHGVPAMGVFFHRDGLNNFRAQLCVKPMRPCFYTLSRLLDRQPLPP